MEDLRQRLRLQPPCLDREPPQHECDGAPGPGRVLVRALQLHWHSRPDGRPVFELQTTGIIAVNVGFGRACVDSAAEQVWQILEDRADTDALFGGAMP